MKNVSIHLKTLVAALGLSLCLAFAAGGNAFGEVFLLVFCMAWPQFSWSIFLARRLLRPGAQAPPGLPVVGRIIGRLLLLYLLVLAGTALITLTVLASFRAITAGNGQTAWEASGEVIRTFLAMFAAAMLLSGVFIFFNLWKSALVREYALQRANTEFALQTLRSQVNPHFLFNSLNTLASLIPPGSVMAELFVYKLASVYRYVLDHRDADRVSLADEIAFVNDYFYLQQIRDENKIRLIVNLHDLALVQTVPVSVQVLVENALKHNIATVIQPLTITISRGADYLEVKNNLQRKQTLHQGPGLGLENLDKRMTLLTGKRLQVSETADEFIVKLPLISAS